jgi:glycine/D-amino acid oxidase-like deaminating enzyme
MNRADVAIAGAGIIGLTTALELAAAGCRVTVFDQSEAMSEASRAAAGMLAGADPESPAELQALARFSLARYPEFLTHVETLSGKKILIRTTSTVQGVLHDAGERRLTNPRSRSWRLEPALQARSSCSLRRRVSTPGISRRRCLPRRARQEFNCASIRAC